jgi:hypothetical protein
VSKIRLTPGEKIWIERKWNRIRKSQINADEAGSNWTRINAEINDLMDRRGETDIVQRAKIKGASLPLKDALETGKWHAAESQRHIDDLTLFLKLRELEVL